jgi:hypothetical protein
MFGFIEIDVLVRFFYFIFLNQIKSRKFYFALAQKPGTTVSDQMTLDSTCVPDNLRENVYPRNFRCIYCDIYAVDSTRKTFQYV